nr:WecB/TagA/CpsF family glycosyltransferase [Reichenbachiella agariperforans]
MVYEAKCNAIFRNVIKNADYICPDGVPLLYASRIFGDNSYERVAGNDMIFSILQLAEKESLRVFFYGSTEQVLNIISKRLDSEYGSLNYKCYSPPFRKLTDVELHNHAEIINEYGANIVLVGLGCPKQEIWMEKMKPTVEALMLGVGGAFPLFAGIDTRAPLIVRRLALEWVYRWVLEPKRLFKRYLVTNTYFCYLFIKELVKKILK